MRHLAGRVSTWNRARKYHRFLDEFAPTPETRVLDVGFSDIEYSSVDNYLEKHYRWPESLVAVGIDEPNEFHARYPAVRAFRYDGNRLPFADQQFDVVWSNAVLEHVGPPAVQAAFVRELARVSAAVYLTTPNRYFPIETHTRLWLAHWLPKRVFDRVAKARGKSWATGDYMHLMGRRGLRRILSWAGLSHARIVANRIWPFALDFVVIARRSPGGPWS